MIVNAWGVTLSRRSFREADRLVSVYTETRGRLAVRFAGVNKPGRKLKALSEPLVLAELRLFVSPRTEIAKAIGGQLVTSFPSIRGDWRRTAAALSCCERLAHLTPLASPNPDKYALIVAALEAIEAAGGVWVEAAFALRLLESAGLSLREWPEGRAGRFWSVLHEEPLEALAARGEDEDVAREVLRRVDEIIETQAGRALRCREFAEQLARGAAEALPC